METQVIIIGGGSTGTGIARDLSLRGIDCVLVEKGDFNSGASGANHGLLHSGARYVVTDPETAGQCRVESELLKRLAPQCIEDTGGLFVAVEGDDERYITDFQSACARQGIPCKSLEPDYALELEPALSDSIIAAFEVRDATVDPFRLSLENISEAVKTGARLLCHKQVRGFEISRGRIRRVSLRDTITGEEASIEAEQIINSSGAWAGEIAALAGVPIDMVFSKGSMMVTFSRLSARVINRLRLPTDGDILVPGGSVSVLGTTSVRIPDLEDIRPSIQEIDHLLNESAPMIPSLQETRFIRAFAGVRPLVFLKGKGNDRNLSRGFFLMDHQAEGVKNFVTVTGGKLTTYRHMAESASDLICRKLGVSRPCLTLKRPLPSTDSAGWTSPGPGARRWIRNSHSGGALVCECEMQPADIIREIADSLHDTGGIADLSSISLRSRIGKGSCQGTICGLRLMNELLELKEKDAHSGLRELKEFLKGRWKGEQTVLWGTQLIQAELKEAIYCGLLGLEGK